LFRSFLLSVQSTCLSLSLFSAMKIAWFLLHPNISYYCNCSYRCEPYAIIQSIYVVIITEYLRESADEKVNNLEGESATRSILLQPLYKEPKNVDVNLEFKLYNLENAAIRVHAFYNYLWRIPLIFYSLASTLTFFSSSPPFLCNTVE